MLGQVRRGVDIRYGPIRTTVTTADSASLAYGFHTEEVMDASTDGDGYQTIIHRV